MIDYRNIDGLELLKSLDDNSIDFVLTDPPYEIQVHGGGAGFLKNRKLMNKHISYIGKGFDYDNYFNEYLRILKTPNIVLFCSNAQVSKTMQWFENKKLSTTLLVWKKPNPIPAGNGKYISNIEFMVYVRGKGATFNNIGYEYQLKTFEYQSPHNRIHPTEKPIDLLRRLLLIHTNENDIVVDTFAGSLTTAIACHKERRKFVGSEIDKKMFDKSLKRYKQITRQTELF